MQIDHNFCVVEEVCRLMDKGYTCYLEYCHEHMIVDIYAKKGNEQIVIEVGFLHGALKRLQLLNRAYPDAKIIWITTLYKNFWLTLFTHRRTISAWVISPSEILKMADDYIPANRVH